MHCVLLIPDGVGLRNFVLGRFLRDLSEEAEVTVFHIVPPERLPIYSAPFNDHVSWSQMVRHRESPASATLRYSLAYAQMYWANAHRSTVRERTPVSRMWLGVFLHPKCNAMHCAAVRFAARCNCRGVKKEVHSELPARFGSQAGRNACRSGRTFDGRCPSVDCLVP